MQHEPRQMFEGFVEEVWNQNNPARVEHYIAPEYQVHLLGTHQEGQGVEWVKHNVERTHREHPGLQITIEESLVEGDRIACRLTLSSHQAGKRWSMREFILYHIQAGKFVEAWTLGSAWKEE